MNPYHPDWYRDHIRMNPLLPVEEERELVRAYQNGDKEAGDKLLRANLLLVLKVARKYPRYMAEELVQEGNRGLVEALDKFDPSHGTRFCTYAAYWARARILTFLRDNRHIVNVSRGRAGRKIYRDLHRVSEYMPGATDRELADEIGVDVEDLWKVKPLMHAPAAPLHLTEQLCPAGWENPEVSTAESEQKTRVRYLLFTFRDEHISKEREQIIWDDRIMSSNPVTLSSLGKRFGVSRERVNQVERKIKKRLRTFLSENNFGRNQAREYLETING